MEMNAEATFDAQVILDSRRKQVQRERFCAHLNHAASARLLWVQCIGLYSRHRKRTVNNTVLFLRNYARMCFINLYVT